MNRKFYAPIAVVAVMAAMAVVGGVMQGQAAKKQANEEAKFLDMQADQERKQLRRDQDDLKRNEERTIGRQRALLAAGGGISAGSDLNIITSTAGDFAIAKHRMTDDSETRSTTLNMKASSTRKAGQQAQNMAIMGGVMKGASMFAGGFGGGMMPAAAGSSSIAWNGPRVAH